MKRPLFLLAALVGSATYWTVWFGLTGVILMIHGDCGAGTTEADLTSCVAQKTWIFWGVVVLALGLYIATLVGLVKRHWPKD